MTEPCLLPPATLNARFDAYVVKSTELACAMLPHSLIIITADTADGSPCSGVGCPGITCYVTSEELWDILRDAANRIGSLYCLRSMPAMDAGVILGRIMLFTLDPSDLGRDREQLFCSLQEAVGHLMSTGRADTIAVEGDSTTSDTPTLAAPSTE